MNIGAGIAQRLAQMAVNAAATAQPGALPPAVRQAGPGAGAAGGIGGLGTGAFPATGGAPGTGPSFGETLKRAIGEVSAAQENSAAHVNAFLRGEDVELHQVMAAAEEAGIALEMMIEIRNKFTEAYRTVINMQS